MTSEGVQKAITLARKVGHILVATAGRDGWPHVAVAECLTDLGEDRVGVEAWFCPGTVENAEQNPRVSVVVWDKGIDDGVQLLGRIETVEDVATLNGYDPRVEPPTPLPQVERRLVVKVERALAFTLAPHSDLEEVVHYYG